MGRVIHISAGVRAPNEHERVAHRQHTDRIEELGGDLMELAAGLLRESKTEACQHTKRLVDLSERVSLVAGDVHRYLEDLGDLEEGVRV